MQEGKTTNNYNDLLKSRMVKEMHTKCAKNVCANAMKYGIYDIADIAVRCMSDHGDLSKH